MGTRIGHRTGLAWASAATLLALTACGAPAQPPPQTGGASLSTDILPYDDIEFRTDRPSLLEPGKECEHLDEATREKIGLTSEGEPSQQDTEYGSNGGCSIKMRNGRITVYGAQAPFDDYWMGAARGVAGSPLAKPGLDTFERKILKGRYHAVEYATNSGDPNGMCVSAVDTGSPNPLVIEATPDHDSINTAVPYDELKNRYCPVATLTAEETLRVLDPRGGSRAQ